MCINYKWRKGNRYERGRIVLLTLFNLIVDEWVLKFIKENSRCLAGVWVTNGARTRDPQNHNLML